jgi:hypothetical protein
MRGRSRWLRRGEGAARLDTVPDMLGLSGADHRAYSPWLVLHVCTLTPASDRKSRATRLYLGFVSCPYMLFPSFRRPVPVLRTRRPALLLDHSPANAVRQPYDHAHLRGTTPGSTPQTSAGSPGSPRRRARCRGGRGPRGLGRAARHAHRVARETRGSCCCGGGGLPVFLAYVRSQSLAALGRTCCRSQSRTTCPCCRGGDVRGSAGHEDGRGRQVCTRATAQRAPMRSGHGTPTVGYRDVRRRRHSSCKCRLGRTPRGGGLRREEQWRARRRESVVYSAFGSTQAIPTPRTATGRGARWRGRGDARGGDGGGGENTCGPTSSADAVFGSG